MSAKATGWLAGLNPFSVNDREFRVLFHMCDAHVSGAGCRTKISVLSMVCNLSETVVAQTLDDLHRRGLLLLPRSAVSSPWDAVAADFPCDVSQGR